MKTFLIADNSDTLIGLRLAGIDGVVLEEEDDLLKLIKSKIDDEEIGIIMLTKGILDLARDEIMKIKLKTRDTLIIEIPGIDTRLEDDYINRYIRESIGVKF